MTLWSSGRTATRTAFPGKLHLGRSRAKDLDKDCWSVGGQLAGCMSFSVTQASQGSQLFGGAGDRTKNHTGQVCDLQSHNLTICCVSSFLNFLFGKRPPPPGFSRVLRAWILQAIQPDLATEAKSVVFGWLSPAVLLSKAAGVTGRGE